MKLHFKVESNTHLHCYFGTKRTTSQMMSGTFEPLEDTKVTNILELQTNLKVSQCRSAHIGGQLVLCLWNDCLQPSYYPKLTEQLTHTHLSHSRSPSALA